MYHETTYCQKTTRARRTVKWLRNCYWIWCVNGSLRRTRHWHTKTYTKHVRVIPTYFVTLMCKRPEPSILSGGSRKCSMRSAFFWFAEFCHSQRLSHFAASFIVVRAETSIAKSCEIRDLPRLRSGSKLKVATCLNCAPFICVDSSPTRQGLRARM